MLRLCCLSDRREVKIIMNIRVFKVGLEPTYAEVDKERFNDVVINYGGVVYYYGKHGGLYLFAVGQYKFMVENFDMVDTDNPKMPAITLISKKPNYALRYELLFDIEKDILMVTFTTPIGSSLFATIQENEPVFKTCDIDTRNRCVLFKKQYKLKEFFNYVGDSEGPLEQLYS